MKKLHSILALLLALALAFSLAACGGEESKPADDENNTAPSITGVADGILGNLHFIASPADRRDRLHRLFLNHADEAGNITRRTL